MTLDNTLADSPAPGLTLRQRDCLIAIQQSFRDRHIAPTVRELAGVLDCQPNTVHQLLVCLEERGAICRISGLARGIEVLRPVPMDAILPDVSPYLQRPVLSMADRMRELMKSHRASHQSKVRLLQQMLAEQQAATAKPEGMS